MVDLGINPNATELKQVRFSLNVKTTIDIIDIANMLIGTLDECDG